MRDEAYKLFFNTKGTRGEIASPLREMLTYINNPGAYPVHGSKVELIHRIEEAVEEAKMDIEWREAYMMYQTRIYDAAMEARMKSPGVINAMRHICTCDDRALFAFRMPDSSLKILGDITERYLLLQLGHKLRTLDFYIEYEVSRQQDVLEDGDKVIQETRLFDSVKGVTMSMRDKEEAHDYRYFPDPDLVPVHITDEQLESWKARLPELPAQRRRRFMDEWKLPEQDADIITSDRAQADLFEAAVALYNEPRKIANYMTGPMLREINQTGVELKDSALKPEALAELAKIVDGGLISAKIAQDIFSELYANGVMPEAYVREKGLVQVSDTSAIDAAVAEVIAENPAEAEAYKGGKTKLISFFVGQVMRKMKGKANPALVNEALGRLLK